MARNPAIVYVEAESRSIRDDNPERDALVYFLGDRRGYELLLYDYCGDLEGDFPRLKKYVDCNLIIAVIVKQSEYVDDHERVTRFVRGALSKELPIVVLPGGFKERFQGGREAELVYAFDHTDSGLMELVDSLAASWEPKLADWLGAETAEDRGLLFSRLERAYQANQTADDEEGGAFGVPDHNHMVVAEALRIKLLPAVCLKGEFDDAIQGAARSFGVVRDSVYRKELARVRKMNDAERLAFDHMLMRIRGHEPAEGGGAYVRRATCGNNVNGFAIDPVTFQSYITHEFGMHHMAGDMLVERIQNIEALRRRKNRWDLTEDEERECRWRLFTGLIFLEVEGFTTPILQLYGLENDPDQLRRVARFLKRQQQFIPVDPTGKLIGG